jgi:hypothetical protein
MKQRSLWAYCASLLILTGCGSDDNSTASAPHHDAGATKSTAKNTGATDAGVNRRRVDAEMPVAAGEGLVSEYFADQGDGWKSLIQAHWILAANSEQYRCARLTATQDIAMHSFRPVSPLGTHHTVLTVTHAPTEPDGLTVCSVSTNAQAMLAGSGVGTNDYTLPDGVAIMLHKGDQLLINLHLFNVSDHEIEGTSGMLVQTIADDQIMHEAEAILAGPISLNIPAHSTGVVQSGTCTLNKDATLVGVGPHAHMHATHFKVTAHSSIVGDVVIHDADYSFDSQLVSTIDGVEMKKGDTVDVACTYDNNSDKPISFGDSSLAEMCFAGLMRYPTDPSSNFLCAR